jgi:CIC family chloride channel protein
VPYKRSLETGIFLPALIATFTSYIVTVLFAGPQRLLLNIKPFKPPLPTADVITSSIGLGVTAAVLVYIMYFIKNYLGRFSDKYKERWFIFPLLLTTLIVVSTFFVSEDLAGSGDVLTEEIFNEPEKFDIHSLLIVLLGRSLLLPLSLTWGATGGLFMPLVSIGAVLGLFYALLLHVPTDHIYPLMFAGVSAVFSGGQKTLMTSVFLGVEFLGFGAFFSSTIAAATAYLLTLNVSLIAGQLPEVQDPKKRTLMEIVDKLMSRRDLKEKLDTRVTEVMNRKVTYLRTDMTVEEALSVVKRELHNNYPVVGKGNKLMGEVSLEDIITETPKTRISDLMTHPTFVHKYDTIKNLVNLMISSGSDRVYVVDESGKLLGVVSKTDLLRYALKMMVRIVLTQRGEDV